MTSEICVANRRAIVLAADSAATVSQWHDGSMKERYYKGANKIFQFSESEPVGVMIYDTATLHAVPWETIIKDCRRQMGRAVYRTLDEYAAHLFGFIEKDLTRIFTADQRRQDFMVLVYRQYFQLIDLLNGLDTTKAATTAAELKAVIAPIIKDRIDVMRRASLPPGVTPEDVQKAIAEFVPEFAAKTDIRTRHPVVDAFVQDVVDDVSEFWELVVRVTFQRYRDLASKTGVVVAGFGSEDYFPGYVHYHCFGFLPYRLALERVRAKTISISATSEIEAFAQTEMAETFMIGMAPEVLGFVAEATDDCLATVTAELTAAGATLPADWTARLEELKKQ